MIDVDARHRLDGDTLRVLDAIYEMAQGAVDVPLSRDKLREYSGESEETVTAALRTLIDDVRRIRGLEFDREDVPTRFALVYVPQGDAYGAYWALYEPRDAQPGGCAARARMEEWQGRWSDLAHVDFDAGLEELGTEGWAERCETAEERWRLTPRGIQNGRSRLKLR